MTGGGAVRGRSLRQGALLLTGQCLNAGGLAITTVLLARWLGPDDYGLFALLASTVIMLGMPADFGVAPAMARYLRENRSSPEQVRRIVLAGFGMKLLLAGVVVLALWGLVGWDASPLAGAKIRPLMWWLAALLFLAETERALMRSFEALGRLDGFAWARILGGALCPVLALSLVLGGAGLAGALGGRALALALEVTLAVVILLRVLGAPRSHAVAEGAPLESTAAWWPRIVAYALPLALATAGFFFFRRCDVLLIEYFLDSRDVAFYSIQSPMLAVLQVPAAVLGAVVAPWFADRGLSAEERRLRLQRSLRWLLMVYVPIGWMLALFAEPAVTLLFGADYLPGVGVVQLYSAVFLPFYAAASVLSMILGYQGEAGYRAAVVGAAIVVNVLLHLILIPRAGIMGAAVATQLAYVPVVLLYANRVRKTVGLPWRADLPDLLRVLAGTVAAILLALVVYRLGARSILSAMAGTLAGALLYAAFAWCSGLVRPDDLRLFRAMLPARWRAVPGATDAGASE